jgi:hypothetical protein
MIYNASRRCFIISFEAVIGLPVDNYSETLMKEEIGFLYVTKFGNQMQIRNPKKEM